MNRRTQSKGSIRQSLTSRMMASAALALLISTTASGAAYGQAATPVALNIRSQSLGSALTALADRTDLVLLFPSSLVAGKSAPALSGSFTADEALSRLLAGSGLSYSFTGANTVTIVDRVAGAHNSSINPNGSLLLDTIDVTGGSGGNPAEEVYTTPGSVFYVTGKQIDEFKGTNAADLLKSAPGVFSGESRSSAGLDVNIRGMQGQGRVAVTVDGAANSTALYRGYQGISNSTFIDPDFIGGILIEKGPTMGASGTGAIGGTVSMRTVSVDDIVPEGKSFGARFKMEGGTNTTSPWSRPYKSNAAFYPSLLPPIEYNFKWKETELDRPALLDINSGSASVLLAARSENIDVLAGFARRKYGNYHAGESGDAAPKPVDCDVAAGRSCNLDWYRTGLTAYLPGEEVLNTSQDTYSALLKTTLRFADDHKLDLGYSRFDSIYGETFPSGFWNNIQPMDQRNPAHITVDGYTARYNWNPDSDLVDLKWNAWLTKLDESTWSSNMKAEKWGEMYGTDISNTSRLTSSFGDIAATYGVSYVHEATGPSERVGYGIPAREGIRHETSVFADTKWSPFDWIDINGGLRWHTYASENTLPGNTDPDVSKDAWDYSVGVTLKPIDGLEVFGTYRNASRLPSLFESTGGFMTTIDPNLRPEEARTWETGVNYVRDGVFTANDAIRFKASYFDSTVDDYISRSWLQVCNLPGGCTWSWQYTSTMYMANIDRAHFSGIDLSARYEYGGFSADLAGTYYTDVEFCRTLATCKNSSLAADYATNQIPPKYSASLTLSQKLLEDRLTLSTRISRIGPRAGGAEPTSGGANPFIAQIPWKPYTLVDLFMSYKPNDALSLNLSVENLFDTYYVDPLSLALMPGPGRTIRLGVTGDFSENTLVGLGDLGAKSDYDWSGFYAGLHGQVATAKAEAFHLNGNGGTWSDHNLPQISGAGFGGQIGYTHHFDNNFVLGLEGSISKPHLERRSTLSMYNERFITTDVEWMASARAKAGFAVDRFMVYGLGGYSAAGITGTYELISGPPYGGKYSGDVVHQGWTVGGGLEVSLTKNLSLVGEYSFTKFSGDDIAPAGAVASNRTYDGLDQVDWEPRLTVDEFRVGLNYRF